VLNARDFESSVLASLQQPRNEVWIRPNEVVVMGQTPRGEWKRLRLGAPWQAVYPLMVRGFLKQTGIGRLAFVVGKDFANGRPHQLRLAWADRTHPQTRILGAPVVTIGPDRFQVGPWTLEPVDADPSLIRLIAAAHYEWSGTGPQGVARGRSWSIAALVLVLTMELAVGLYRVRWVAKGAYSWLPMLPPATATIAFVLYLSLIGVVAFGLWRRLRLAYALALALAAVQFARPIALVISELHSATWGHLASLLTWGWLFPAYILLSLGLAARWRHRP
jgi:hypothetical protein